MIDKKLERWLLLNYPAYWELKPGTALLGFLAIGALGGFLGMIFPIDHIDTTRALSEMGALFGLLMGIGSAIGFAAWLWQMHQHRVERGFGRLSLGQDYIRLLGYFVFTMLLLVPTLAPNAFMVFRIKQTFYGDFTRDVDTMSKFLLCVQDAELMLVNNGSDTLLVKSVIGADPTTYRISPQELVAMRKNPELIQEGLSIAKKYKMRDADAVSVAQIIEANQSGNLHLLSSYDWDSVARRMNMFHDLLVEDGVANYKYFPRWVLFAFSLISFLASIYIYTIKKTGFKPFLLGALLGHGVMSLSFILTIIIAGVSFTENKRGFFPVTSFFIVCLLAMFIFVLRGSRSGSTGTGVLFSMSNLTSLPVLAAFFWWGTTYALKYVKTDFNSMSVGEITDLVGPYLAWGTLMGTAMLYLLLIFPFAHKAGRRMMASPKRK